MGSWGCRGSEPSCTGPPGVYGLLSSTPPTGNHPDLTKRQGQGGFRRQVQLSQAPSTALRQVLLLMPHYRRGGQPQEGARKPRTVGLQVTQVPPTSEAARSQESLLPHDTLKTLCPEGLSTVGRDRQLGPPNPQKRPEGKEIPSSLPGAPQPACQLCPPHRESSPRPQPSAAFSWLSLHHGLGELRFPVCTPP